MIKENITILRQRKIQELEFLRKLQAKDQDYKKLEKKFLSSNNIDMEKKATSCGNFLRGPSKKLKKRDKKQSEKLFIYDKILKKRVNLQILKDKVFDCITCL